MLGCYDVSEVMLQENAKAINLKNQAEYTSKESVLSRYLLLDAIQKSKPLWERTPIEP